MKTATQDKILQRASRIFFTDGLAVGIDRITLECDVAKMTIYSLFQSKDGLICAILDEVRRALTERIGQVIEPALPATIRLRAMFNLVCYGMNDPALMLGLGVRALAEFPCSEHPVHQAALELDRAIMNHLQAEDEPTFVVSLMEAQQLLLLAKGCFLMVPLLGLKDSRQRTMELAHLRLNRMGERSCVLPAAGRGADSPTDRQPLLPATSNP